jgi:membrane fusion protein (multidrug efflux system)
MRSTIGLAVALLLAACSGGSAPSSPPVEVSVVRVDSAAQPLRLAYSGRTRGAREIEVRARVSGILQRRYYHEGDKVAAGDRLFRIDPNQFIAAVHSAEGRLGVESARLAQAERQRTRVTELFARGFVSGRNHDEAEADYAATKASVDAARAELQKARLDLSYTDVRAPISGVTGQETKSEGSLIDATDQTSSLLTTIAQTNELYVDFSMPGPEAQLLRAATAKRPITARLLATGSDIELATAPITFIDTRVDADTGTVNVRATLPNGDARLSPGQFVRVELAGLSAPVGSYLPIRAIGHGTDGPYIWKIDGKGLAQMERVRLGASVGNLVQVESGIVPGNRVVVEGALKLQPGSAVHMVPAAPEGREAVAVR